ISELLPEKEATKLLNDLKLSGMYKLPKEMAGGFAFSDLQLRWNQQRRSWRSVGDKVGIAAVADKQVNKRFKGHFEMVKRRSGNMLNIYIEISPREWYFYTYRQG